MTDVVVAQRMWQRRDTAANWTSVNPVLARGEIGIEIAPGTTTKIKVGDGSTAWATLPYFSGSTTSDAQIDARINIQKGAANGIAPLDARSTLDGGNF